MLHEGCWTVTEFQKRWLTVVTLPNYGIQLISREHENEYPHEKLNETVRLGRLEEPTEDAGGLNRWRKPSGAVNEETERTSALCY